MKRDWILGFGAFSTLLVLVYADLALAWLADRRFRRARRAR
jgi:hypothetical protein